MHYASLDENNQKSPISKLPFDEPLISVTGVCERILVYPYYYKNNIPGAVNDCYLREGVVKKLIKVADSLPTNYSLVILDGWRSIETQKAIYDMTKQQFQSLFDNESDLLRYVSKFVALPSTNPPSPHYTGGAVDLTIATEDGWLNMGTDFDEFTEKASSLYYEEKEYLTKEEFVIRNNRRLLRNAMESVGFCMNLEEWWHFDYGNARWAKMKNKSPIYEGIELKI